MNNYIAVDIGASSGRLILGNIQNQRLGISEIHRFSNGFTKHGDSYIWDIDNIIKEILIGLEKAKEMGITHCNLGIDTWAVDYVLVDKSGKKLKNPVSYRDDRTRGIPEIIEKHISKQDHYNKTGIQFLNFNTIYQLYTESDEIIKETSHIMLIPDYIVYYLTGKKALEYTNVTTTSLVNHKTKDFDSELLDIIGIDRDKFPDIIHAHHSYGGIKDSLCNSYKLPICNVLVTTSHDTASAVLAVPSKNKPWAYISSGTWSLLGIETNNAITCEKALDMGYSNEGGAYGTYRFLKNIMGLWIIQELRRIWIDRYKEDISFETMVSLAEKEKPLQSIIDVGHNDFLNPSDMIETIQLHCKLGGYKIPKSLGELSRCVFDSLALSYKEAIKNLEDIIGYDIEEIYIIGGGSQNMLLNKLTSQMTGKKVISGPVEATAIGNIICQLISNGEISDISEARELVRNSFNTNSAGEIRYYDDKQ